MGEGNRLCLFLCYRTRIVLPFPTILWLSLVLLLSLSATPSKSSCVWNVHNYGTVDLTPLKGMTLSHVREDSPGYSVVFSFCAADVMCAVGQGDFDCLAVQASTAALPMVACNAPIAYWDSGHDVHPQYNEEIPGEVHFFYPPVTGFGGCVGGRDLHLTLRCNREADPYSHDSIVFYQDPQDENGICAYHLEIDTVHACPAAHPKPDNDKNGGADDILFGLSIGWLLVIVVPVLLLCYCLVGYIVNAIRNKDLVNYRTNVPQWGFWMTVPSYVKAGCMVTFQVCRTKIDEIRHGYEL